MRGYEQRDRIGARATKLAHEEMTALEAKHLNAALSNAIEEDEGTFVEELAEALGQFETALKRKDCDDYAVKVADIVRDMVLDYLRDDVVITQAEYEIGIEDECRRSGRDPGNFEEGDND